MQLADGFSKTFSSSWASDWTLHRTLSRGSPAFPNGAFRWTFSIFYDRNGLLVMTGTDGSAENAGPTRPAKAIARLVIRVGVTLFIKVSQRQFLLTLKRFCARHRGLNVQVLLWSMLIVDADGSKDSGGCQTNFGNCSKFQKKVQRARSWS